MKNLLLISVLISISLLSNTQVTDAADWTKTDCDGTEHDLFTELDAGNVVIMELVMLDGCMPCITAANLMQPIIDQYNANYENRVKWYTMGYNDTYACEALITWKSDNEINCAAQFEEGADQIDYYGGMGMPTIVVVGRNTHQVYFNKFGFIPADTIAFADAIEYALGIAEPVAIEDKEVDLPSLSPNPAIDNIQINGLRSENFTIHILNSSGAKVFTTTAPQTSIDVSYLPSGVYFVQILIQDAVYSTPFVRE